MPTLGEDVRSYRRALEDGSAARAYKGILAFVSQLQTRMLERFPACAAGAFYPGYLDMTDFALTPPELRERKLKLAVVYLHAENRFELWLAANNRALQAEAAEQLFKLPLGGYEVTRPAPGVDAIIAVVAVAEPDFDRPDELTQAIADAFSSFLRDMTALVSKTALVRR